MAGARSAHASRRGEVRPHDPGVERFDGQFVKTTPLTLVVSPTSGLSPRSLQRLTTTLIKARNESFPASFNLGVYSSTATLLRAWGGHALEGRDGGIDATADTIYDLASMTKVVCTTTLALRLVQDGTWRLSDRAARWLPGFQREDITLKELLTHTSGLIPHIPFFALYDSARQVRKAVYDASLNGVTKGSVSYSDLNFMLLGWALERATSTRLDTLFRDVVAGPLDTPTMRFRPPRSFQSRIAATERDGDQRRRKQLVWGDVHDGNAWSLGGVAGHAGLFARADDVGAFTQALLAPRRHHLLSTASVRSIAATRVGNPPDVRGLGWRLDPRELGDWPEDTIWHTGFTGTCVLIAPSLDRAVVLLCNAVHPVRQLDRQARFRSSVYKALEAVAA
jgi:CubicO group peptidase (beta-lactamase class C family)